MANLDSGLDKYDLFANGEEVAFIFYMHLPPATGVKPNTSGLDCLTAILRVTYANILLQPLDAAEPEIDRRHLDRYPTAKYVWDLFVTHNQSSEIERS